MKLIQNLKTLYCLKRFKKLDILEFSFYNKFQTIIVQISKIFYFFLRKKAKKIQKGHVAQWTRACGYEPQSRGFESLLAQKK